MRRELIESYYEEYQRELERFLESDPEMFSLEAEIHHYIEILEPVLRDAGQEMWQALDRIISAKNAMEGIVAKEMYIRGFLDYERLVCEKDSKIYIFILQALTVTVGASFLAFFKNHLTFFKSPRVISKKNKFFCESTVQRYSETCN